ncbi:hypothetical protein NHX12_027525 [Muraenolepis orangiensis]|uniref:Transcription factor JunB n=1 Tax=Muraenolepis orangiensis TaxID=630683 RepID=A0A9Q0EDR8_9TELE|nr:hypothetical protein NHX12_027525 [Muraenolepis orangiensis]
MDAFYHDTFTATPPNRDSVPPHSCLLANHISADTSLTFLYPGHAHSNHTASNHGHRPSPRTIQEQEGFADGFVHALASLHQQEGVVTRGMVTGVFSANGPSNSPRPRKKLRNCIASSRCRHHKLERIAQLEERVRVLHSLNGRLLAKATRLRGQVWALRGRTATHLMGGQGQIVMVTDGEEPVVEGMMEDQVMSSLAHRDHTTYESGEWLCEGNQEQFC